MIGPLAILMLLQPPFQIVGAARVIAAIGTFQYIHI
ncbi:MAG: hypothetical protein PWQ53_1210, partial [Bacteroidota bacterium]|nr:hypothetical protein [Bacteroidota bacterium]